MVFCDCSAKLECYIADNVTHVFSATFTLLHIDLVPPRLLIVVICCDLATKDVSESTCLHYIGTYQLKFERMVNKRRPVLLVIYIPNITDPIADTN